MPTLRELREAAGLTQLELANQLSVTPGTVYNWERGRGEPRARQVPQLAQALGIPADVVLAALVAPSEGGQAGKVAA
jgi:transcriptional regulator with XRE-family HTH domain